ncbi:hypothetical protein MFERI14815_00857 [Mycoplasma feriruminatoris]|uniref:Lipoprotein n=1 Tax=Mycoplasma feriruminatoris TaxID=1179777 RepID=A0A654IQK9_9MOLU|nr:lipoprotein [Mycoplasma feriruminatoris]WFQ92239.1 hypothetical protein MFERI14815_00857 [Mycoplasma feriruminatoris]VZS00958.1 hypothetical protein MF5583_00866 [Mycoplasma feriruminatoris]
MKKLLTILGSVGLIATTSAAVVACGDRTAKTSEPKKEEENRTEESKKEEDKSEKEDEKDFSKVDKNLGNLEPDKRNILSQAKVRDEIAKKLGLPQTDLQGVEVDYEKNTASIILPKFDNQKLEFKFTSFLDLGKISKTNKNGRSVLELAKIKEEIAKKMGIKSQELQELNVDSDNNTGTVHSTKFAGTLSFKFTTEENKNK